MITSRLKTLRPSSSYQLELPEQICEQSDERVLSFWLDGAPLLLQLSSYIRDQGAQPSARQRLKDRIAKHGEKWSLWKATIHPDATLDQATAEFTDDNHVLWIHSYLVWSHLTVYLVISGPTDLVRDRDNWALRGIRSVRLTTH